ncbi:MAG: tRNA lysidine(34) synthetase TilS [Chlorobiota bacterium]
MCVVEEVQRHVSERFTELGVQPGSRLLCAVSGGVDSIVLLDVAEAVAPQLGLTLGIAHADHGLRGDESRHDALFVQTLANERRLPAFIESIPVQQYARRHRCGIEEAARQLRYEFLQRCAIAFRATHVATAHTADDNAETVLLHLLRGTGLEGLAGIPPRRELFPGCWLIRPLLQLRKAVLTAYARARGLSWREDSSNRDRCFRRNRIRWELLPTAEQIVPKSVENINRCSTLIRRAAEGIGQLLEPLLLRSTLPDGGFFFPDTEWDALPTFFRGELLRHALQRLGHPYSPPAHRIEAALALRTATTGKRYSLAPTTVLIREHSGLSLVQLPPPWPELTVEPQGVVRFDSWELEFQPVGIGDFQKTEDPWVEYMDADRLPPRLQWRAPKPGDRFHPLGMPKAMKLGDFLTNQRLPHWRRLSLTVLADGHRILWVCGVRLSEDVKITPTTRRVTRVRLRRVGPTIAEDDATRDH